MSDGRLLGALCLLACEAAADTTDLLGAVLAFLDTLAALLVGLLDEAEADEDVLGVELLGVLNGVVDAAEASGLATTKGVLKVEEHDGVGVLHLEHLGDLLLELSLGDASAARVEDIHHKLAAGHQGVGHILAGANSHSVVARHPADRSSIATTTRAPLGLLLLTPLPFLLFSFFSLILSTALPLLAHSYPTPSPPYSSSVIHSFIHSSILSFLLPLTRLPPTPNPLLAL